MPSELEFKMLARLDELEKEVVALKKKLAVKKPVEAPRRVEKKVEEVKGDAK